MGLAGSYEGFDLEIRDPGIALITFNQPERLNGMTFSGRRDLVEVLQLSQLSDEVRVVVITGTGRAFCAGMDITGNRPTTPPTLVPARPPARHAPVNLAAQLVTYAQELPRTVRRLDKLTIAAVNGFAI